MSERRTTIAIFDTATQGIRPLTLGGDVARIYTCGITPNDDLHVGHAKAFVTFDVLRRVLLNVGIDVRLVRNVTDIDDDMVATSRRLGVAWHDLADRVVGRANDSLDRIRVLPPSSSPYASSAIIEIQDYAMTLIEREYAYVLDDGTVMFDSGSWPQFGVLSRSSHPDMVAIASARGGRPEDPRLRDPLDFVIWQAQCEPDEPAWDSPWGRGRPGWHVECTVLASRELGSTTLDIHGGGSDLIFPHHECSSVQWEAQAGMPLARHWMHIGMVQLHGIKMSKSLGNLVYLHELLVDWEPAVVRLALLAHHYRGVWDWTEDLLVDAAIRLDRWRSAGTGSAASDAAAAALRHDLDTPRALAVLDAEAEAGRGIDGVAAALLGVDIWQATASSSKGATC